MASLTGVSRYLQKENTRFLTVKLTNGEVFYTGGYYCVAQATGRLTELTDAGGKRPLGILVMGGSDTADLSGAIPPAITGDTSASPEPKVDVDIGEKMIEGVPVAGASAITDVGDEVYLETDNVAADLKVAASSSIPAVGIIVNFNSSTSFDVLLYSYATMLAK